MVSVASMAGPACLSRLPVPLTARALSSFISSKIRSMASQHGSNTVGVCRLPSSSVCEVHCVSFVFFLGVVFCCLRDLATGAQSALFCTSRRLGACLPSERKPRCRRPGGSDGLRVMPRLSEDACTPRLAALSRLRMVHGKQPQT